MKTVNGWIPECVSYHQPGTAAVLFDPEGGHHVCYLHSNGLYWSAGMLDKSPEALANRIHADWFRTDWPTPDNTYARQEACFGELP